MLSVIVFAHDEEENVAPVLAELGEWLDRHEPESEIVFVDDGSHDASAAVAEEALRDRRARVVRRDRNGGIGAAIKTGVRAASGDYVTFVPADGQIPPDAIGTLLGEAREHDADLVLSVYADRDDGLHRKVLSAGIRGLITVVHGVRIRSEGPYLFRRELFVADELPPDSFFLNFEFPIRCLAAGLLVRTVTIHCRKRLGGQSKTTALKRMRHVTADLFELRVRRTRAALERALGRPIVR
jgi:dolichol-phosphate mannosyltransferase